MPSFLSATSVWFSRRHSRQLTSLDTLDLVRKALLVHLSLLDLLVLDLLSELLEFSLFPRGLGLLDALSDGLAIVKVDGDNTYDSSTSLERMRSMCSSDLTISA